MATKYSSSRPLRSAVRRTDLRRGSVVALLALAVLFAACRPAEPTTRGAGAVGSEAENGLRVRLELAGAALGAAPATVHVLDGSQGVSGASVEVQGDMSHAGMQPVIVTAVESEPGVYRAEDFGFTMAGDWFVTATVETADGRKAIEETFVSVRGQ